MRGSGGPGGGEEGGRGRLEVQTIAAGWGGGGGRSVVVAVVVLVLLVLMVVVVIDGAKRAHGQNEGSVTDRKVQGQVWMEWWVKHRRGDAVEPPFLSRLGGWIRSVVALETCSCGCELVGQQAQLAADEGCGGRLACPGRDVDQVKRGVEVVG